MQGAFPALAPRAVSKIAMTFSRASTVCGDKPHGCVPFCRLNEHSDYRRRPASGAGSPGEPLFLAHDTRDDGRDDRAQTAGEFSHERKVRTTRIRNLLLSWRSRSARAGLSDVRSHVRDACGVRREQRAGGQGLDSGASKRVIAGYLETGRSGKEGVQPPRPRRENARAAS